jgi:hypothetical protein
MFYRNKSVCFFGRSINSENHAEPVPIVRSRDHGIQLEVGQVHGVCNGDRFAIYPISLATDDSAPRLSLVIATVVHVEALTSIVEKVDTPNEYVETGWMATPLTCFSLRRFPI